MRDALEDYQQALTIEPSSEIYLKVGTILTGMQKFNEATEYYTKANTLLNDYSILVAPTDK
jgi:HemY protein